MILPKASRQYRLSSRKSERAYVRKDPFLVHFFKSQHDCSDPQISFQILYASIDRLIERLVDPRLPGTDFMDTFLVTYRYFTNGKHVLQALIAFYHHLEEDRTGTNKQLENGHDGDANNNTGERKISKFPEISLHLRM